MRTKDRVYQAVVVFDYARWRKGCKLAQDRRAWGASVCGVAYSIGDAGSTRHKHR